MNVHVLILEVGETYESVLQEIIVLLSKRPDVWIAELSHEVEHDNFRKKVLSFPGLEIHIKEQ